MNKIDLIHIATIAALTPQGVALLQHIVTHGSVTQREALLDLGIQSLTKRIHELRQHFVIVSDTRKHKTSGQRYVRYFYKGVKPVKEVAAELARKPVAEGSEYETTAG